MALEQIGDMGAGCLPVVAEGDDLADLAQGQADRLSGPNEPEPLLTFQSAGRSRVTSTR